MTFSILANFFLKISGWLLVEVGVGEMNKQSTEIFLLKKNIYIFIWLCQILVATHRNFSCAYELLVMVCGI